jgi:hypothetical protein
MQDGHDARRPVFEFVRALSWPFGTKKEREGEGAPLVKLCIRSFEPLDYYCEE